MFSCAYRYDVLGRVVWSKEMPSGDELWYSYTASGRLRSEERTGDIAYYRVYSYHLDGSRCGTIGIMGIIMFSPFPTDAEVISMIGAKEDVRKMASFCGRKAYQLVSGQATEIVDARTGIRLARYNGDREVQRLVYARWKLKKSTERGYYEIRCSQD